MKGENTPRTTRRPRSPEPAVAEQPASPRRGRPPKFGRPSQVVALTLPEDVLDKLRDVHADPGWAIVQLVERALETDSPANRKPEPAPPVELAHLPGRRALILTQPEVFSGLPGISTIPLADGRAFLAFDTPSSISDLEVSIIDRLDDTPTGPARAVLEQVRDIVRGWRRHSALQFKSKSIIVVEGGLESSPRPLAPLHSRPSLRSRARTTVPRPR